MFDPPPTSERDAVVCCYANCTGKIQVARISNIPNWYFERVVFPGQRLMFEAPVVGQLEIHTGMMASAILSDTIPCSRLVVVDDPQPLTLTAEDQQKLEYMNEGTLSFTLSSMPGPVPSVTAHIRQHLDPQEKSESLQLN
jgi:hypothetical protein